MATVYSDQDAENLPCNNYPKRCTVLSLLKQNSSSVFVVAQVERVYFGNNKLEEQTQEEAEFAIVVMEDQSGKGYVVLRKPDSNDSQKEAQAKDANISFFFNMKGKIVYILNAKVKEFGGNKVITVNQWSQLRELLDEKVIELYNNTAPIVNEPNQQVEKRKKSDQQVDYIKIITITPNLPKVNILAKVTDLVVFKSSKGFLEQEGEPDSYRVTLTDLSGSIYGVFPKLPKFEKYLANGNIVSLMNAKVHNVERQTEGESSIFITVYLKDEKHKKYRGRISVQGEEQCQHLAALSVVSTPLDSESASKDLTNVSNKIWIPQPQQQE